MGAAGALLAPEIVPASVLGREAPSNKIQIGQIGVGRIARAHDLPEVMRNDVARVVAVCDVDSRRAADGKAFVERLASEARGRDHALDVRTFSDYREMLDRDDVDAMVISTPDH